MEKINCKCGNKNIYSYTKNENICINCFTKITLKTKRYCYFCKNELFIGKTICYSCRKKRK